MASDLGSLPEGLEAHIQRGDSRDSTVWVSALGDRAFDSAITSPPYLNNFDYADATRLELYFWGVVRTWREMTTMVRGDMMVASTQQCRVSAAAEAMTMLLQCCPGTARRISRIKDLLALERLRRARGKEYDLLLPSYFADLASVLGNARRHAGPGARVAFVLGDSAPYGLYIDTPALVASVAVEMGFVHLSTHKVRKRGLRWRGNGARHSVELAEQLVLLEWPDRF
jgi:hypothetical protein